MLLPPAWLLAVSCGSFPWISQVKLGVPPSLFGKSKYPPPPGPHAAASWVSFLAASCKLSPLAHMLLLLGSLSWLLAAGCFLQHGGFAERGISHVEPEVVHQVPVFLLFVLQPPLEPSKIICT